MAIFNNYASVIFFLVLFSVATLDTHVVVVANHVSKALPTLFIFGDSTFDVGTNSLLNDSGAKANVPYYGIDFYNSIPTGRFSNGFNTADEIARLFGYHQSPPPFLALEKFQYGFKQNILGGANFASGGSGILHETGQKQWTDVVSLGKQVNQFASVQGNISEILGPAQAASFVSKALFLISTGSNDLFDFASNNFTSNNTDNHLAILQLGILQANYDFYIRKLYDLGARKFGILSVAPIGCCPAVTSATGGNCVKPLNDLAVGFHSATLSLLKKLSKELKDFEYSLGDTFSMTVALLKNPSESGLKETKSACCGIGKFNGEGPCVKAFNATLCPNRSDFLFWDWFHPTERASELAALALFGGGTEFVFPVNFMQLVGSGY